MTLLEVYVLERLEEIRSRLALLKTSVTTLKLDSWHVFNSFYSENFTPPFVFPTSVFSRLEENINLLEQRLQVIHSENLVQINRLTDIKNEIQDILFEFNRLQNVFAQRISGLGLMNFTDFQPIQGIEYGDMAKVYNAVDALTFELVERILGKEWIRLKKYTPLCQFDREYAIDLNSFAISVPYYDNYRSRFWPALAHEVSHIFVDTKAEESEQFERILLDAVARLMEILGYDFSDPSGRYYCSMQAAELFSDIIATFVCPPSFLTGAFFLNFGRETGSGFVNALKEADHPPMDSRLLAMEYVLQFNGILDTDEEVKRIVTNIHGFMRRNNTIILSHSAQQMIKRYNRFALNIASIVTNILPSFGLKPFVGAEWLQIMKAFERKQFDNLTPIQLVCASWLKRIKSVKSDSDLLVNDYFLKRRNEPKTFENNIKLMYNYYKEKINKNIIRMGLYDICINVT